MFVVKIPVKNLAMSTVNYLVTKPSHHKILLFSIHNKIFSYSMTYRFYSLLWVVFLCIS